MPHLHVHSAWTWMYICCNMLFQGTQSSNPHNDYCQHFVDTGQRPQNFIRDVGLADRFEEYPKLRELIKLKDELIATTATPPMYLKCDLKVWCQPLCKTTTTMIILNQHVSPKGRLLDSKSMDQIMLLSYKRVHNSISFILYSTALQYWCSG